ncbi:MAG: hypothetical protein ABI570_07265 [Ilumatobacteraceae bacterium]
MGDEPKPRTPEEIAREHARMQREIENQATPTPGGLSPDDIAEITKQESVEDEKIYAQIHRDAYIREKQLPDIGRNPMMDKPQLDDDVRNKTYINTEIARDLLKKPENRIRLVAAGLGIFAIILFALGLRTDAKQTESVATTVPTTVAPTTSTTAAATSAVITPASSTARASFTKVSGPCNFATQFTDDYLFETSSAGLTLTQLSDNHVTYGTIEPTGEFATSADSQAYDGIIDGTMVTGQHFYTAGGCNEVYDFTMQLSEPLIATVEPPRTTTTETTATTSTAVPANDPGNGRNTPLLLLGIVLLIGAIALFFGGSRLTGGPVIAGPLAGTDPCDAEKKRMAAAERDRDAADERLRQFEELERNVGSTQRDATTKQQVADAAAKNASSYQGTDGQTVYTDRQQGGRIAAAQATATAARQAAEAAQRAFDTAGGSAQRQSLSDDVYRAHRECDDAKASLDSCLRIQTALAPPQSSGGQTTSGGTTPTGPLVATVTGSTTQTRERPCTQGEVKPGSENSRTKEITVNEMNRAIIGLDAVYPNALSVPLAEFVEFMDFFRRAFKAGKAIHTVVDGKIVEGALDTIDATEIQDVPDFLTYWDKLTEATLKGLKQTGDLFIERFGKLGDYQLTFTRRINTATCRTWEECDGGQWIKKTEVKIEVTRTERNCRTRTISVLDKSEIPDAINRLFIDLERENDRGTRELTAFADSCGS